MMGDGEFDLLTVVTRDTLSYLHGHEECDLITGPASYGSVNSIARANRLVRSSSLGLPAAIRPSSSCQICMETLLTDSEPARRSHFRGLRLKAQNK